MLLIINSTIDIVLSLTNLSNITIFQVFNTWVHKHKERFKYWLIKAYFVYKMFVSISHDINTLLFYVFYIGGISAFSYSSNNNLTSWTSFGTNWKISNTSISNFCFLKQSVCDMEKQSCTPFHRFIAFQWIKTSVPKHISWECDFNYRYAHGGPTNRILRILNEYKIVFVVF